MCHGDSAVDTLSRCAGCATYCHPDCATAVLGCPSQGCLHDRRTLRTLLLRPARGEPRVRTLLAGPRELLLDLVLLRDLVQLTLLAGLVAGGIVCLFLVGLVAVLALRF